MEFNKLSAPTLKELFVQELEDMILSGKLAVGTRLPPERELAQQMQVSRAVVNSGLTELAQKGFLIVRPRVGTEVADYRKNGTLETFITIMKYNGGHLQKDEVRSILELRKVFDIMTVRHCIPYATDEQIANLGITVTALCETQNIEMAIEIAFKFQHELAFLSQNTLLPIIFTSFKEITHMLWQRFCLRYGVAALQSNTLELYRHIANRDLDGAIAWIESIMGTTIKGEMSIY